MTSKQKEADPSTGQNPQGIWSPGAGPSSSHCQTKGNHIEVHTEDHQQVQEHPKTRQSAPVAV
ncbi:mCG146997 [Mus musculus]|nr:mCG146997 [Mus musculus]